ncbi:hypothetical protein ACIRD3_39335 [Kitasatospora sp. NPDC093550]|uniref:hypothetical protein n=1 Tax=Kitasatospora sp. NPDC093550 TaxID=3364089 RepID=UPI00380BD9E2
MTAMTTTRSRQRVRRVDDQGVITTVVPGTEPGPEPFLPTGVAVDADGILLIADVVGRRVLRLGADGAPSTIGGPGDHATVLGPEEAD